MTTPQPANTTQTAVAAVQEAKQAKGDVEGDPWGLVYGTIVRTIGDNVVEVTVDGDTKTAPAIVIIDASFADNARCTLLKIPPSGLYVIGHFGNDWQTYACAWTSASNPQPAIGNGTLTGRWLKIGRRTVIMEVGLLFGTTTTPGTGRWFFSTPFTGTGTSRANTAGAAYMFDNGVANRTGIVALSNPPSTVFITASPSTDVTATAPQTWNTSDELRFSMVMETTVDV